MKLLLSLAFVISIGCQSDIHSKEKIDQTRKPFFDFNEVLYFNSDINDLEINNLITNRSLNKKEKSFMRMLTEDFPQSLNELDTNSLTHQYGYTKQRLDSRSANLINKILSDKKPTEVMSSLCLPVFRDIIVLLKHGKISGLAKICFTCKQYYFVGQSISTENFGTNEDFNNLKQALQ